MGTLTIRNIDDLEVRLRTGAVMGMRSWSETRVAGSSSGGGGYLTNGTGNIDAPDLKISSSIATRHRYFIREADGAESEMSGNDPAVRDGHKVSVIYLLRKGKPKAYVTLVFNHDTRVMSSKSGRVLDQIAGKPKAIACVWLALLLAAITTVLGVAVSGGNGIQPYSPTAVAVFAGYALAIVIPGFWYFRAAGRARNLKQAIDAHIRSRLQTVQVQ